MLLLASVAVCLLWGAVATWSAVQRASAANPIVASTGPLSYDAQQAYRSLSDADATEANAYLSGIAPTTAITRIHDDISRTEADVMAIRAGSSDPVVQADLTTLATGIPTYTDLVGEADAFNREQVPVGGAWLGDASNLMHGTLLPAASDLYQKENARLNAAYAQATGLPYLAAGTAILIGLAAFWAQRWLAQRTRRVLNLGLVAASLIGLLSLAWLLTSFASARSDLLAARDQGSVPAQALAQAEITALRMHSDESLTLINRDGPDDSTEAEFRSSEKKLTAELVTAQQAGRRSPGAAHATAAASAAQAWYSDHTRVYDANYNGDYLGAVQLDINNSTQAFLRVDAALTAGIGADQAASARQAGSGDDALGGLAAGMVIAALLMAASCALGISKRIAEYRLAAIPGAGRRRRPALTARRLQCAVRSPGPRHASCPPAGRR